MSRHVLLSFLLALALPAGLVPAAQADTTVRGELRRRAFLGIQPRPLAEGGLEILNVLPGGSAEAAGLAAGDTLLAVDGTALDAAHSLGALLGPRRAGDRVVVRIRRADGERDVEVPLREMALEASEEFEILYDVVPIEGAVLRAIVTLPKNRAGRLPAVFYIQGLTCSSVENMQGPLGPVAELLRGYAREGFAVFRCEKLGIGDSTGEPCSEIGFHREVEGFLAALRHLKRYDFVDPDRVFLFGHSMGGLEAPVVAAAEPVRGILVYGTGVIGWSEYLLDNTRRQARLTPETDLVQLEAGLRDQARFQHYAFEERMAPADVVAAHPELKQVADENFPDGVHGFTRHIDFFRELNELVPARWWAKLDVPVLAVYGEYDYATSAYEHEYIAEIVNRTHPGRARWIQIPKMFHAFNLRASMEEAVSNPWEGPFGTDLLAQTMDWMREALAAP